MEFEYLFEKEIILKSESEMIGNIMLGKQANGVFRVLRVYVADSHRGQGIASQLMNYLVEVARKEKFKLIPVCSFADAFFKRNKQYDDVLVKNDL